MLAQKEYKAKNYWVGKVIHWDMCKKFKKNDTHKLLWDFDLLTDHLISARKQGLMKTNKIKKKIYQIVDFAVLADHRI